VLLACLLGIVLITSEYHHQTATTTFLLTADRTRVVAGKLVTAVIIAALSWLLSTLLSVVAGAIVLHVEGYGTQLGHWAVLRGVLLNLAAYAIWSVFGTVVATPTATVRSMKPTPTRRSTERRRWAQRSPCSRLR
jgi:ABC-2 type transport system permease protein